tara:strand:+ start:1312 stop:1539 length:228 start_codon:yes stop_codon:yes gene_type:complete
MIITTDGMTSYDVAERILKQTDWTQLSDSGLTSACVTAWGTYRAAIRVIRRRDNALDSNPADETWPTVPTMEWSE